MTEGDDGFQKLFDSVSNWGRWGADDTRGTLNTVSTDVVTRAVRLVTSGRQVTCGRPVGIRRTTMPTDNVIHVMTKSGADSPDVGEGGASDWVGIGLHGVSYTHIDAHSHAFWNGKMYNGRDKGLVTTERGALAGGLEPVFEGVTSRGVLVDGPELLGVEVLPDGHALRPDDLRRWLDRCGLQLEPGDILHVRTGFGESGRRAIDERPSAGLAAECMPMLREAGVAMLVSDGINEALPSPFPHVESPVHVLGLVAMGLWIVDNANLATLAQVCQQERRFEFLSVVAPIPFRRATGSLVNPIATF